MLTKVFPIPLKPGKQAEAEAVVEHFADQAAYDAHTSSDAYAELIASQFADLILEFVEIDHELLVEL